MRVFLNLASYCILLFILLLGSCNTKPLLENKHGATIRSFVFEVEKNQHLSLVKDRVGRIRNGSITVGLPNVLDRSMLIPTIELDDGVRIEQSRGELYDFTREVGYTVTTEQGDAREFSVSILSSDKELISFMFKRTDNYLSLESDVYCTRNRLDIQCILSKRPKTFYFTPTITTNKQASIYPDNGVPFDFSRKVSYIVTAEDGSQETYFVQTSVRGRSSEKHINSFSFNAHENFLKQDYEGDIQGSNIIFSIPIGVNTSQLIPSIDMTGVQITPDRSLAQDFSVPVKYVVSADDGTSRVYTIRVEELSSEKSIHSFYFVQDANPVLSMDHQAMIQGTDITIGNLLPIDSTYLIPNIIISQGAKILPDPATPRDFSIGQSYIVTAADGSSRRYSVKMYSQGIELKYKSQFSQELQEYLSLGDYNNEELISANILKQKYIGKVLKYQILIATDESIKYDSGVRDIPTAVDDDGKFYFGPTNWLFTEWNSITGTVHIYVNVYQDDGKISIAAMQKRIIKTPHNEIYTWRDLQNMGAKLDAEYVIMNDISFPDPGTQGFPLHGFTPISSGMSNGHDNSFTGSLDGNGKRIDNFFIKHPEMSSVGLFGEVRGSQDLPSIQDLTILLRQSSLTEPAIHGRDDVGVFAGILYSGTMQNIYSAKGVVRGENRSGGLVGKNFGTIIGRNENVVRGKLDVGGVVGDNRGMLIAVNTGAIKGRENSGGISGSNMGSITGRNEGDVSSTKNAGGLVGIHQGELQGINTGNIIATHNMGGLVGKMDNGLVVGYVHGSRFIGNAQIYGGLVGMVDLLLKHGVISGYWIATRHDAHAKILPIGLSHTEIDGMQSELTESDVQNLELDHTGNFLIDDGNPRSVHSTAISVFNEHFVFGQDLGEWTWRDRQLPHLNLPQEIEMSIDLYQ